MAVVTVKQIGNTTVVYWAKDAGGQYQETWQTANAGWVTGIVNLNKDPVLPKTGY